MTRQRRDGFTIVEVLVAMVLLGLISAAIVGTFSLMTGINRAASSDVDYSRIVRSVYERTKLDWSLPLEWENERVAGTHVSTYVSNMSDGRCNAEVIEDAVVPDAVRVVRVSCEAEGDLPEQVYNLEFGKP